MFKVIIQPRWKVSQVAEDATVVDMTRLLTLLSEIHENGSINQASLGIGLSYRYAWGLLRDAEAMFGQDLLVKARGRGTTLTPLAEKLLWAERRVLARLSPTLESLASELELELQDALTDARQALRINASHGFAVASLLNMLQARGTPIDLRYRNSIEAVAALARNECDLAGFHIPIGEFQASAMHLYSRWLNPMQHRLIHLAVRNQGLFVALGNPKKITMLADLIRTDVRYVNRQVGSGTRMLMDLMLAKAGIKPEAIAGYESAEFTHAAIAAYIASGMADVGFGVETAARRFGLDFVPLVQERYFFACRTDALDNGLVRDALEVMCGSAFHSEVGNLAGYDPSMSGQVFSLDTLPHSLS